MAGTGMSTVRGLGRDRCGMAFVLLLEPQSLKQLIRKKVNRYKKIMINK